MAASRAKPTAPDAASGVSNDTVAGMVSRLPVMREVCGAGMTDGRTIPVCFMMLYLFSVRGSQRAEALDLLSQ